MFKLGCDPEIFLTDAAENLRSAIGVVGGTKEFPRPLPELGEGYAIQEDNVAVEFNIPPADTKEAFIAYLAKALEGIKSEISWQGLQLCHASAAFFPKEELQHPAALEFGCDPDFNAWTGGKVNPKPTADDETLRSCGGHLHIGLGRCPGKDDTIRLVKLMDLYASVPAVIMDNGQLRKQLYGKAGAFRPKTYGVEYRPLSNFWVFNPKLVAWAYDVTQQAVTSWENGMDVTSEQDLILEAVNNNNKYAANDLISKYKLNVVL